MVLAGATATAVPVPAPASVREQRVIRRDPIDELRRRLTHYLELRTNVIDAACQLSPAQRGKLLLAGKLDIDRWHERFRGQPKNGPENQDQPDNQNGIVVRAIEVPGGRTWLLRIFDDGDSSYQKGVKTWLDDEQKRALRRLRRRGKRFSERRSSARSWPVLNVPPLSRPHSAMSSPRCWTTTCRHVGRPT